MKSTVNLRHLAACNAAAPTEETRYYLAGVCVELHETETVCVATDGHILLCARHELDAKKEQANAFTGTLIIPSDAIAQFKPADFKFGDVATVEHLGGAKYLLAVKGGRSVVFEPIDGSFPDWRRVVPAQCAPQSEIDTDVINFDPRILAKAFKAGEILRGAKHKADGAPFSLTHNGASPAFLGYTHDGAFFGLLMPYRQTATRGARPAWIGGTPPVRLEVAA